MAIDYRIDVTCGCIRHRIYICLLCFLGLTLCYIMRFTISIAITEMVIHKAGKVDPNACPTDKPPTTTETHKDAKLYDWSELEQGMLLSSFFWGYVITQIPGGMLADRFGPRRVLVTSVFFTSVFTLLSPVSVIYQGLTSFTVVRVLLGLAQGCFYAALHTVVARWVPSEERGVWGTLVFSGAHIGNFLQNLTNGFMLDSFRPHWEYIFYIWGVLGMVWVVICTFTTWDSYTQIPRIKPKEAAILNAYYEKSSKKSKVLRTPWMSILKSCPVWAILLGMIGHDWGLFALVVDLPKYMKSVLRFDVKANGTWVACGYLALCVVAYASGYFVDFLDKKKCISITWNRKIFTTIASVGPSVCLLITHYMACNRALAVTFLVIGMCTMGTFYPSLKVNCIDLAPNHAGVIGALGHSVGALAGIGVPFLIGAITTDNTRSQWMLVWWITFAVMSVTNIYYVIFASGEIQPWNSEGLDSSPPPPPPKPAPANP